MKQLTQFVLDPDTHPLPGYYNGAPLALEFLGMGRLLHAEAASKSRVCRF